MLVTKYIIELTYLRSKCNLIYYYRGQNSEGHVFDYHKNLAKRYDSEDTANYDLQTIITAHANSVFESARVVPIRCRA